MAGPDSKEGSPEDPLTRAAFGALAHAYAPYSRFPVGAALETGAGEIVTGCNIENASLGLGLCAERVALFQALAKGLRPGRRMVIATRDGEPTPPCGACRQVLKELASGIEICSVGRAGRVRRWKLTELLPPAVPRRPSAGLDPRQIIARKRDGMVLDADEINALIRGLLHGEVEEHQMSAFLMAVYLRGMNARETRDLSAAMSSSGSRLDLSGVPGPRIDKHSTGGVGDKVSIPLLPLAVAAGVRVPMISGRGLGHTGGTLDKLESIPGYRTALPASRLRAIVMECGGFIAGQTDELAPADRIMYALRDITATVDSIPLIVSSILSKKLCAGLTGLVLDVKFGQGAFMEDRAAAERLALALVEVAESLGMPTVALLTHMDEPIGRAVGNALEVRESFALLGGGNDTADLRELTLALGGLMLVLGGLAPTMSDGAHRIEAQLRSGQGAAACRRWIAAQGGSVAVVDNPDLIPVADHQCQIRASEDGYVACIDALQAGRLCVQLGGGRRRLGEAIDHAVGIVFHRKCGERVARGDALYTLYLPAASSPIPEAGELVTVKPQRPATRPLVAALVTRAGISDDPWDLELGRILALPASRTAD